MTPDKPSEPKRGKPAQPEKAAAEAKEATEAQAREQVEQEAKQPEPKARKKSEPAAEGTAADETGVEKTAAAAEKRSGRKAGEAGRAAEKERTRPKKADEPAAEEAKAEEPKADEAADVAEPAAEEPGDEAADVAEPAAEEPAAAAGDEDADVTEPTAEQVKTPEQEAPENEPEAKPRRRSRAKAAAEEAPAEDAPADEAPAEAARPAPRRRRDREPVEAGVLVHAQAKYVRTSARKARLVCDHIRGKDVTEARAILAFTPRAAAKAWTKLLESAVANAEHNHELVGEELRIHSVHADEGPTLKRFRPRAMGRATRIRKRTSHLSITLTPKES